MKLLLGKGIGNIQFGMRKKEMEYLYGIADDIRNDGTKKSEKIYQYNDIKTRVTYYKKEQKKLGYIRSRNKKIKFKGNLIIGKNVAQLKTIFPKLDFAVEKFDFWIDYFNEENWLNIRTEYSDIIEIELGVPFKIGSDRDYNWPIL